MLVTAGVLVQEGCLHVSDAPGQLLKESPKGLRDH